MVLRVQTYRNKKTTPIRGQRQEPETEGRERWGGRVYHEATQLHAQLTQNKNQLRSLECSAPGMVRLREPEGPQDMALHTAAISAARMRDLKAHVVTAEGRHRAQALMPCGTTHALGCWDPGG